MDNLYGSGALGMGFDGSDFWPEELDRVMDLEEGSRWASKYAIEAANDPGASQAVIAYCVAELYRYRRPLRVKGKLFQAEDVMAVLGIKRHYTVGHLHKIGKTLTPKEFQYWHKNHQQLSLGHMRAISGIVGKDDSRAAKIRLKYMKDIVSRHRTPESISVRQAEADARVLKGKVDLSELDQNRVDNRISEAESHNEFVAEKISHNTGYPTSLKSDFEVDSEGDISQKGYLSFRYTSTEQLAGILEKLHLEESNSSGGSLRSSNEQDTFEVETSLPTENRILPNDWFD